MFGDRDTLARRAREALDAEADERLTGRVGEAATRMRDALDAALKEADPPLARMELPYPLAPLASRKAPEAPADEPDEDFVELSVSRGHRDRLDELSGTLLELPEDRATSAAAYELASLVSRWDTGFRVGRGLRALRWMRGL